MDFQSECCKFGNFGENFILTNNAKKICIRLPASVNDRVKPQLHCHDFGPRQSYDS